MTPEEEQKIQKAMIESKRLVDEAMGLLDEVGLDAFFVINDGAMSLSCSTKSLSEMTDEQVAVMVAVMRSDLVNVQGYYDRENPTGQTH